ncbi:MAG: hypothetical protein KIT22_04710, partial [Verrucomicrobiae bacterium]|nr:hypothetical protein [Verrucomicrobiae bacterium]
PESLFQPAGASNGFLRMVTAAQRAGVPPAPTSMKVIAPGQAVEAFRQTRWLGLNNQVESWESLEKWHRDSTEALEDLHQSLLFPECRDTLDWRQGFTLLLSGLTQYKGSAQAMAAAALVAATREDRGEAIARIEDIRRVERALESEPVLISQLVRVASAYQALPVAWDLAQRSDWEEPDLAALQRALPSTNFTRAFVASLWGEAALWAVSVKDPRMSAMIANGGLGSGGPGLALPSNFEGVPEFVGDVLDHTRAAIYTEGWLPIWRFAWYDQALAFHLRATDELARRWETAGDRRSLKSYSAEGVPGLGKLSGYDAMRFHFTPESLEIIESDLAKAFRIETQRTLIETGIAIHRFLRRHGRAPRELAELVPDWLEALPVDTMDGQPLRYRVNPEGTWRLWSVGDDFKDDDGDPTPLHPSSKPFESLHWWKAHDTVLPARAAAAEVAAWQAKEEEKLKMAPYSMDPILARRYGLILRQPTNSPSPSTNAP